MLEGLPSRNVVSWNGLIAGYAQEVQTEQALNCFQEMQCEGILPSEVTTWNGVSWNVLIVGYAQEGQAVM